MGEPKSLGQMLAEPFHSQDLYWRLLMCGKNARGIWAQVTPYVTARAVMRRLDDVCGADGWQNTVQAIPYGLASGEKQGGAFISGISIRCPRADKNGEITGYEWVTKHDGASVTEIEPVKGAISDALKRTGVLWGIARYLREVEDCWAIITQARDGFRGKLKGEGGEEFFWYPPPLPKWALPGGEKSSDPRQSAPAAAPAPDTKAAHGQKPDDAEQREAILGEIAGIEANLPQGVVANLRKRIGGDLEKASLPQLKALLNALRDNQVAQGEGGER